MFEFIAGLIVGALVTYGYIAYKATQLKKQVKKIMDIPMPEQTQPKRKRGRPKKRGLI